MRPGAPGLPGAAGNAVTHGNRHVDIYRPVTGLPQPSRCYPRQMNRAVDRRPLRADAARNVDKIITAARQCFREHGPEVPLQTIAVTAGVGPATLVPELRGQGRTGARRAEPAAPAPGGPRHRRGPAPSRTPRRGSFASSMRMSGRQRGSQPARRCRGTARAAGRYHGRTDRIDGGAAGARPGPGNAAQRHLHDGHDPAAGHADRRRGHDGGRDRTPGAGRWHSSRTPSARNGPTARCRRSRRCPARPSTPSSVD